MTADVTGLARTRTSSDRSTWNVYRFDQIAQNITDRVDNPAESGVDRYVGLEHLDSESLQIRRWGTPADVEATKLRFQPGDIIFGKRRAYQRKLAVADFAGICSAHALVLRARSDVVDPEFLPFFMQSNVFFDRALAISVGSLSPTINWRTLAAQKFALPPMEDQRRIAEALKAATDSVHGFEMSLTRMGELRDVLLAHEFDHQHLSQNPLSRFLPLGEIVSYASDGPFGSKLKTEHYAPAGARVVRLQNIGDGEFDDGDRAYISLSYYAELRRYALLPNDILVAGLGDENHPVGRACLLPPELRPAINKADWSYPGLVDSRTR
jgi:type I restriction enzyme, S subunit